MKKLESKLFEKFSSYKVDNLHHCTGGARAATNENDGNGCTSDYTDSSETCVDTSRGEMCHTDWSDPVWTC